MLNALIEADRVTLLSGNVEPIAVPTDSGRPHVIYPCASCKVAVWSVYGGAGPKLRFVRVGTLDNPAAMTPDVHIYVRSKLPGCVARRRPFLRCLLRSRKLWPPASLERRCAILDVPWVPDPLGSCVDDAREGKSDVRLAVGCKSCGRPVCAAP